MSSQIKIKINEQLANRITPPVLKILIIQLEPVILKARSIKKLGCLHLIDRSTNLRIGRLKKIKKFNYRSLKKINMPSQMSIV